VNLNRIVTLTDEILPEPNNAAYCIPKPVCLMLIMEIKVGSIREARKKRSKNIGNKDGKIPTYSLAGMTNM
jgi:hypothetical protein